MLEDLLWAETAFARYTAPLIMRDLLQKDCPLEDDEKHALHCILSEYTLDDAVAALSACCLAIGEGFDTEHPESMALLIEAERLMRDNIFESGNYALADIYVLEEDIAALHYSASILHQELAFEGNVMQDLLNIICLQLCAQLDIVRAILDEGENCAESESEEDQEHRAAKEDIPAVMLLQKFSNAPILQAYSSAPVNDNL